MPATPFASSPQLNSESFLHTETRIIKAAAMMTICLAPFLKLLPVLDKAFMVPTRIVIKPRTPARPLASSPKLRLERLFSDVARIRIETDIPSIIPIAWLAFLYPPPNFSRAAIAATSSMKSTVIPERALPRSAGSIVDITNIAAARIAIAPATLSRTFAFRSC